MKFQQLRFFHAVATHRMNISEAADALYTSQPNVSRQLQALNDELGVELFVRTGKRLTGLSEVGVRMLPVVEGILNDAKKIRDLAAASQNPEQGVTIGASRYGAANHVVPAIAKLSRRFPDVRLSLLELDPSEILQQIIDGTLDLGVLPTGTAQSSELLHFPLDEWWLAIVTTDRAQFAEQPITLSDLANTPLITYSEQATTRQLIDYVFASAQVTPGVICSFDSNATILSAVKHGVGVGIISESGVNPSLEPELVSYSARHLFPSLRTCVVMRKSTYPRDIIYALLELLSPNWTRSYIDEARHYGQSHIASGCFSAE